jgi:hypothetical protein
VVEACRQVVAAPLIRHIVRANSGRVDFLMGQADDRRSQLEARHARASD